MPSAAQWLCDMFLGGDQEALAVVETNFTLGKGFVFCLKDVSYKPTEREWYAINYLCDEWDYAYIEKEIYE